MTASTDIRWFRYTNTGAPQLSNNWGVMIPLLDACLVTGFSDQLVVNVTIDKKLVTLKFEQQHNYLQYQVITVSGAEVEEVNGTFRIVNVSEDGFEVSYELEEASVFTESDGYVFCKLEGLGWEKAFEGVDKAAYRSSNESLNTRPYLRVADGLPSNYGTTSNNYLKFARVGIVEEMTSIDNLSGVQAPYDSTLPNKNWDTTMVGTTAYPGWSKWIYTWNASYTGNYSHTTAPANGNRDWILVGDSDRFYLFCGIVPTSTIRGYRYAYGFGAYDTFIRNDYSNTFLMASNDYRATGTSKHPYYLSPGVSTNTDNGYHIFLQRAYNQTAQYSQAVLYSCHITYTGATNAHSAPNSYATVVPFPCYIRDSSGYVRGNLPNYFWIGQTRPFTDLVPMINNKDEIVMPILVYGHHNSSYVNGMVMLKIGDA